MLWEVDQSFFPYWKVSTQSELYNTTTVKGTGARRRYFRNFPPQLYEYIVSLLRLDEQKSLLKKPAIPILTLSLAVRSSLSYKLNFLLTAAQHGCIYFQGGLKSRPEQTKIILLQSPGGGRQPQGLLPLGGMVLREHYEEAQRRNGHFRNAVIAWGRMRNTGRYSPGFGRTHE